jgi:peptidoglycan lytic transglycosylase G
VSSPTHYRSSGGRPRRRVLLRRTVALVVLAACAVALAFLVRVAFDRMSDSGTEARPMPVAPPPPKPLRIIFPEGFTREQMAERITAVKKIARQKRGVNPRLDAERYLAVTSNSPVATRFARDGQSHSLEGFLFPATYEFSRRTTSQQLVRQQVKAFRRAWKRVDLRYARSKNLTPYDVLIIASMIEEEVIAPKERRLVAAVIYNRLREGMPLGIDATIRYALDVPPTESLRVSHLEHPTPYNTRVHAGLPPGPITNPGLESMRAAADPADVDYLFFVRKPDKVHHFFTRSEQEFFEFQQEN